MDAVFTQAKEAGAEMVVTTEKDSVRVRNDYNAGIAFYYTKLEIDILSGSEDFENAVERICFPKLKKSQKFSD